MFRIRFFLCKFKEPSSQHFIKYCLNELWLLQCIYKLNFMRIFKIFLRNKFLLIHYCGILINSALHCQSDIPIEMQVTLPSPTAIAFHKYGNTDVDGYSGSISVPINLAIAQSKTLSSQVVLNYSSSNGVRVEEVPTWIGLGWTLNAGGLVSRVIRDRIDDGESGYTNLPELPSDLNDPTFIPEMLNSFDDIDTEPDKFFFKVNGISGSFFIKKQGEIMQVKQSDIEIIPLYQQEGTILSEPGANLVGSLYGFDIISPDGVRYKFREYEYANSRPVSGSYSDNSFKISSWYLSEISHPSHSGLISFDYDNHHRTVLISESTNNRKMPGQVFEHTYIRTETWSPRLKRITHEGGEIEFIKGDSRCDFADDNILESIRIKNIKGELIKKYSFEYSYFTEEGVVPFSDPCDTDIFLGGSNNYDGDYRKRLKLDRILEWDESETNNLVHSSFEYDQTYYLPNRHSKARDHWGYYNGHTENTSLEPKYTKSIDLGNGEYIWASGGTAEREPDAKFSRAGILTKIKYKTGGYSEFEYEANEVFNDGTSGTVLVESSLDDYFYDNLPKRIDIIAPVNNVTLHVSSNIESQDALCRPQFRLTPLDGGSAIDFALNDEAGNFFTGYGVVPSGSYSITMNLIGNEDNICPGRESLGDIFGSIYWSYLDTELNSTASKTKVVGGVRIRRTEDFDGPGTKAIINEYEYEDEAGNSSGFLVNEPEYGYALIVDLSVLSEYNWASGPIYDILDWIRTYNSNLPLTTTRGNVVGYNRVIKKQLSKEGIANGYTVFEYTSPKEFPDFNRGWFYEENYFDDRAYIGSDYFPIWPPGVPDSRDWLRGVLDKKTEFDANGNLVKEEDFVYNYFISPNSGNSIEGNYVRGLKMDGEMYKKFYNQHSSWFELKEIITKNYDIQAPSKFNESKLEFSYDSPNRFMKIKEVYSNSEKKVIETRYKYLGDYSNPTLTLNSMLQENMTGIVMEQHRIVDGKVTEALANRYLLSDGNLLVSESVHKFETIAPLVQISTSIDGFDFPDFRQLSQFTYYSNGNLKSSTNYSNGITTSYIWGYNQTLPIVKIENASWAEIEDILGDGFSGPSGDLLTNEQLINLRSLSKAFITNYTYSPGKGITTITDSNGQITEFEYDAYGRLILVKDNQKRVIEKTSYKYAQEAE